MNRNNSFPYAAIGDPARSVEQFQSLTFYSKLATVMLTWPDWASQEMIVASFLGAADAVARGESVFYVTTKHEIFQHNPGYLLLEEQDRITSSSNTEGIAVLCRKDSFLTSIDLLILLKFSTDKLVDVGEEWGDDKEFTLNVESPVPDCV